MYDLKRYYREIPVSKEERQKFCTSPYHVPPVALSPQEGKKIVWTCPNCGKETTIVMNGPFRHAYSESPDER